MNTKAVILLLLGICFFAVSAFFIAVSLILTRFPGQTGKTTAVLSAAKHKKDVTLYSQRSMKAPPRKAGFLKHLTKGCYVYTVGEKTYKIHDSYPGTPRQMPHTASVVYLKRFPRFSFLRSATSTSELRYVPYAAMFLLGAIGMISGGISLLFAV